MDSKIQTHEETLGRKLVARTLSRLPRRGMLGPRQSGKTTLAKNMSKLYFDAEQPSDPVRLDRQWKLVIAGCASPCRGKGSL